MAYALALAPAGAAGIRNLDDKPHEVDVKLAAQSMRITLPPGQGFTTHAYPFAVIWHGREIVIDRDAQYAIWDDETFGVQRRIRGICRDC